MALILNLDTATDVCSVGIANGAKILSLKESDDAYSHASAITLLIEACRKDAGIDLQDLDAIAISSGPGSYTALRVGAATAKGICYALDKPMIAIDTLAALAHAAKEKQTADFYIPMIDARRMEVYTAVYDQQLQELESVHNLILDLQSFNNYFTDGKSIAFCGNGAPKSQTVFVEKNAIFCDILCSAKHIAPLAEVAFQKQQFEDIAYYTPLYFKAPNITVSKKTLK